MSELAVQLYGRRIGVLRGADYRSFDIEIDAMAMERFGADSRVLSMAVPLVPIQARGRAMRRRNYFAGLMPEGRQLTHMATHAKLQEWDVLGLLGRYGRDVAGAVQIWNADGDEPRTPEYALVSDAEIASLLTDIASQPLGNKPRGGKTSLPGVQAKVVLAKTADGWAQVVDGFPSTHILKPMVTEYPTMIFDEEYASRFARELGLASFRTEIRTFANAPALVIERYDRDSSAPEGRVHQEDLAQALGKSTAQKYQRRDGPSLQGISQLLSETDERAPSRKLLETLTLSVAVGNLDMHAKNLSLLHPEDGSVTMAPVYDVVPMSQYDNDGEFAFAVDGIFDFDGLTKEAIVAEAARWGLRNAGSIVEATLEQIQTLARTQEPHKSAALGLQDTIVRFATNLLDGRRVSEP